MKSKRLPTLKEAFMHEDSELGPEPILTDYESLNALYNDFVHDIVEFPGEGEFAKEEFKLALQNAARYGYVMGWDRAWTEAEKEHGADLERRFPDEEDKRYY